MEVEVEWRGKERVERSGEGSGKVRTKEVRNEGEMKTREVRQRFVVYVLRTSNVCAQMCMYVRARMTASTYCSTEEEQRFLK
jgi:hypothetical protein